MEFSRCRYKDTAGHILAHRSAEKPESLLGRQVRAGHALEHADVPPEIREPSRPSFAS